MIEYGGEARLMDKSEKVVENRLETAPLAPLLFQLAVPTVFAQIVNLLYNMIDRMFVGRIPETGSLALAGLGVAFPVILLIAAFASLVGMGGAPVAAIYMGQKEDDKAERVLGSSIVFLVILSIILSVVFYMTKRPLLLLFGASENTIAYADSYLGIYLAGTISVQMSLGLNQFISAQGFARTSMITVLIGAVLNIILDPIFIYGMNMGVKGAALATVASQTVSAAWVVLFLFSKKSLLKVRREYLKVDFKVMAPVLALGLAPFIMQSTECLVQLTFNTGMQKYGNDFYVGAMTILFSVTQMLFLPMQGLAQGATPIISYNYGAENQKRVKDAFKLMFVAAMVFSLVGTGLVMIFPKTFVSLFTSDEQVIAVGSYGLRIYSAGFLIMGAQCACQQTFLALGQAKISMFLALLRKVILLIPLALILPLINGWGTDGLFYSEPIADVLAVATTVTLFALKFNSIVQNPKRQKKEKTV